MSITSGERPGPPRILVVGAGPVGLTLTHELVRHGLDVRLIDAASGPATTSRAIATHPRSLETYDQMGVVDAMLARGQKIQAFTLFRKGKRLARLGADYSTMPTRFPFTLAIDQVSVETVLREALHSRGVTVEWGVRLQDFEQDDAVVRAVLVHADGSEERFTTPWLVGCDGGHSRVRKLLGLPLIGESSETWLIADAQVRTELPRDSIYWIDTGEQTLMMAPMREPGRWRMLDTAEVGDGTDPDVVAARFSRKFSAGIGRTTVVETPTWTSVFTFQQRMIEQMRRGRCFVAGDAAHVHSPASGQGLNTGVQEAVNLAWKIAMVEQGYSGERLLDSYSVERVPVGRALLHSTKRATFLVQLKNRLASSALPVVFGVVRTVRPIRLRLQRSILGGVSGLRLTYADSPLTVPARRSGVRPAPGERLSQVAAANPEDAGIRALVEELRRAGWSLLVAAGSPAVTDLVSEVEAQHKDWLSVRTIITDDASAAVNPMVDPYRRLRRALRAPDGGWLLVRPDGYLSARGDALDRTVLAEAFAPLHLSRPGAGR
ncbi:FAD-dependent monooxygenase [Nocardia arthritidis]|uniref:NAD(P)-binding protein n=1 Tax=Nocardia arthritidis TaxID=228602 RepID=A0A6G9Y9U2_9NOCA|nr:FAD-dependent monooxygenase [Nocardia arthritidis]QIS10035.1 NAD(P)-binding protein [Nocardia arthritidis]